MLSVHWVLEVGLRYHQSCDTMLYINNNTYVLYAIMFDVALFLGNWERGVSYVHLETLKSLDRETTASYLLNISAVATPPTKSNDLFRGKYN